MDDARNVISGVVAGLVIGLVFGIIASTWLDEDRVKRGHLEHKGQIYILTPGKAVPR